MQVERAYDAEALACDGPLAGYMIACTRDTDTALFARAEERRIINGIRCVRIYLGLVYKIERLGPARNFLIAVFERCNRIETSVENKERRER